MAEASRVLVAMSGGVDSSLAAALLAEAGHDVVGVTMKLWGGPSDTGCCAVSDTDDARRVADRLGIEHHVFNFGDDFERHVVGPYVADHAAGRTPNPCIECNRHLKFDRLLRRADALGFELVATGHHARVTPTPDGPRLARGTDAAKDQSYVLHMLEEATLARVLFPVGDLTKAEVRSRAASLGLRTAAKPDSQDVCFITNRAGRAAFLAERIPLRPAKLVDRGGAVLGSGPAVELVTVGQRKGLGLGGGPEPQYAVDIDHAAATVTVGSAADLLVERTPLASWAWVGDPVEGPLLVQSSAHGKPAPAFVAGATGNGLGGADGTAGGVHGIAGSADGPTVIWAEPHRRIAAGQSVVAYSGDIVVGGGTCA